jgi:hypothetical protein
MCLVIYKSCYIYINQCVEKRYPHWSENYLVYGNEIFAPHPVSVIRGNCGYLVQSKFFDTSLWEGYVEAPPGAFYMDDVWISGSLAKKQVKRFVVRWMTFVFDF